MRQKTISRTCLMIVTILLIGVACQTSARADEEKPFKGWLFADTSNIDESLTWDDLPEGAVESLVDLILNDENSALLPPDGDGPSGLPSQLQYLGADGTNNIGGKTKYDIFGLAHVTIDWPLGGTLYLWEYSIWTVANGDTLFTLNTLILNFYFDGSTSTISGTETVIGGTGRFTGTTGTLEVSGTEANNLVFIAFEGSISTVESDNEDD